MANFSKKAIVGLLTAAATVTTASSAALAAGGHVPVDESTFEQILARYLSGAYAVMAALMVGFLFFTGKSIAEKERAVVRLERKLERFRRR